MLVMQKFWIDASKLLWFSSIKVLNFYAAMLPIFLKICWYEFLLLLNLGVSQGFSC